MIREHGKENLPKGKISQSTPISYQLFHSFSCTAGKETPPMATTMMMNAKG